MSSQATSRQAGSQLARHTGRQPGSQTDRQTGRHTGTHTGSSQVDRQAYLWLVCDRAMPRLLDPIELSLVVINRHCVATSRSCTHKNTHTYTRTGGRRKSAAFRVYTHGAAAVCLSHVVLLQLPRWPRSADGGSSISSAASCEPPEHSRHPSLSAGICDSSHSAGLVDRHVPSLQPRRCVALSHEAQRIVEPAVRS